MSQPRSRLERLAMRDVTVRFGRVEALTAVDVDLSAGEVVLLAGPNGAGKSTLIQVLLGLVRPDGGSLEINGVPAAVDARLRERLGYLPEAVAFTESLHGRQLLRFFARARGVSRARVDEALAEVGLTAAAGRAIRGYSRGMRQRLGLALATLHTPELLILDEPTGGLDQEGLTVLWDVLARWQAAGRMVLLSSHDLGLLERRVDRICLLQRGRVQAFDTPARLREETALPVRVTFALDRSDDDVAQLLAAVARFDHAAAEAANGSLHLEVAPDRLLEILDLRGQWPGAVTRVRVEEPGLDAVYDHLLRPTGRVKLGHNPA